LQVTTDTIVYVELSILPKETFGIPLTKKPPHYEMAI